MQQRSLAIDLAVIGGGGTGRAAAWQAIASGSLARGTRLALVEPIDAPDRSGVAALLAAAGLSGAAELAWPGRVHNPETRAMAVAAIDPATKVNSDDSLGSWLDSWLAQAADRRQAEWEQLALAGVDTVVVASRDLAIEPVPRSGGRSGQTVGPTWGLGSQFLLRAGDRSWLPRRWLWTPPSGSGRPIAGQRLPDRPLWLPDTLGKLATGHVADQAIVGRTWLIIGGSLVAIELAQALARLGAAVILATAQCHLAPALDRRCSDWLQTILEASGVTVVTAIGLAGLWRSGWFDRADQILWAVGDRPWSAIPGSRWVAPARLATDPRFQTQNARVYAAGGSLGGDDRPDLGSWEARVAMAEVLRSLQFWPTWGDRSEGLSTGNAGYARQTATDSVPIWRLNTDPPLVSVGCAGAGVVGDRPHLTTIEWPHDSAATPGFIRWSINRRDRAVGAILAGQAAATLAPAVALMIRHGLPWRSLLNP